MTSTPPDSFVLPVEQQIDSSTDQSLVNSLPEKQVALSPPDQQATTTPEQQVAFISEQQVAITPEQQVAISNPNGQVMESQSNQQLVQQRDQTNSLSLISSSVSKMEKLSSNFRANLDQLNGITSDLPNKSGDTNSDSIAVNKVYSDFRNSISEIGCAYSELSEAYHKFQQSFNSVKTQLAVIYQSIFEKIKTNQVLSEKFLDSMKDKLVKAEGEIANLLTIQENFKIELRKKGFQKQTSLVLSTINKVEQFTHKKEEVEKYNAELVRRDGLLNVERSKLELIQIEMNFSKSQEERLEKDYQATLAKKQELTAKNQQQQKELEALGNDKKKMIAMLDEQMKKNVKAKEQMSQQIQQDHFNRNQNIEKMFDNTLQQINDLQITQSSRGFIIVLDESGSMSGTAFQNCVYAIKEQVKYLKSKFPDDEFCMIQFDSKARITINKSAVQFVNEADIGKKFSGGGTDFYCAFRQVKDVMPLFECKVINIMFVTDGGDSNTAAYLKVLQEIKQEYPNNKFQLFGMAFGSYVSPDNIKDCLKEVNGNTSTITANGKKIQSYFEVNVAEDLIRAFKNMFEAQSASVEEFNAKDKKRREMIAQQQVDAEKMKATLLKQFDDEYGQLAAQLEKLQGDNQNSQTKGQNALLDILNQQTSRLNTQSAEQEKEMQDLQREKKAYLERIKEVQDGIATLEMEKENFRISAGSLVDKDKISQDVQQYEEEIRKLGFSSKSHYDQLKGRLTKADQIEKALANFSSQMTASMSHLNQIREFVYDGIDQISDNIETKESDVQFQLSDLVERSMQRIDPNQKLDGLSPAEKMKFLIMTTSKDEYTRILEDTALAYPFENLYSALELSDLFKLQKGQQKKGAKKDNQSLTVDQYLEKVFKEIFGYKEPVAKVPGMARILDRIAKLDERIEAEEKKDKINESRIEQLQGQKEELEEQLGEFQERIEALKQENEEGYQQFIDDHRRQYDFTRNVIRNIRQAIQLIEYKSRQTNIFQPLQMQCFALEMLSQQCSQINQLAIE